MSATLQICNVQNTLREQQRGYKLCRKEKVYRRAFAGDALYVNVTAM